MTMTRIPEPQSVLDDLSPILPYIYAALETGLEAARSYFANGRPFDAYLASHVARYEAKMHLIGSGIVCAEIANTGIMITAGKYPIRVFKADEGELPAPGPSLRRQAYYQQVQLLLPFPNFVREQIEGPNLVIIWDATSTYTLLGLTLICPRTGTTSKQSVSCYWSIPIPHPATTADVRYAASSQGKVTDLDEMRRAVDDLEDIQLIKPVDTDAETEDEKE